MLQKKYISFFLLLLMAATASAQKAERDFIKLNCVDNTGFLPGFQNSTFFHIQTEYLSGRFGRDYDIGSLESSRSIILISKNLRSYNCT